jgi:hypothetical protein
MGAVAVAGRLAGKFISASVLAANFAPVVAVLKLAVR